MHGTKNKSAFIDAFKLAFTHTVPVLAGFTVLGIAYGILMYTKGYGVLWSTLMSAIAFCGSMQFAAITLLTLAFNPLQAFLLSLLVNARHLFYGISLLEKYKGLGKIKPFLIYTLCDETFSMSCSIDIPQNINSKYFYFSISFLNYIYWVFATFIGGLIGNVIAFNVKGLDFALTALFVVLFLEQWNKKENRIPCLIGILASVVSILFFGPSNLVIPAMLLILPSLAISRKII